MEKLLCPPLTDTRRGPTHRRVGPMQFVSVLSISRSMRSCSAAISTLAILHVAVPQGGLDVATQSGPRGRGFSRRQISIRAEMCGVVVINKGLFTCLQSVFNLVNMLI